MGGCSRTMTLAILRHVDVWELAASTRARMNLFASTQVAGHKLFLARQPKDDGGFLVSKEWKAWTELRTTILRIERAAADTPFGPAVAGAVFMELIEPGCGLPWTAETGPYFETYIRLHLPLRTNPATRLYCGLDVVSPGVGALTMLSPTSLCSAVNLGDTARIHLVVDLRKLAVSSHLTASV